MGRLERVPSGAGSYTRRCPRDDFSRQERNGGGLTDGRGERVSVIPTAIEARRLCRFERIRQVGFVVLAARREHRRR
jgi:hypothetical protein